MDDDNERVAVQCGAGPEAPAWAGQEAAVVLEDMTRYAGNDVNDVPLRPDVQRPP